MPNTITTYYTFQPGTKARSSQVNTNFSNYRGDLLPINENTISASNHTHNVGGPDHYWNYGYFDQIDLRTSTTTATVIISGDTSATLGAFKVEIEGYRAFRAGVQRLDWGGYTTTAAPTWIINDITTGSMDLLFGSNTVSSWTANGLKDSTIDVAVWTTTLAPVGGIVFAQTTGVTVASNSTTGNQIATSRIMARGGGLMSYKIVHSRLSSSSFIATAFAIDFYRGLTTTSLSLIATAYSNVVSTAFSEGWGSIDKEFIDSSYSAGEVVYRTIVRAVSSSGSSTFSITCGIVIEEK
jgi:hypothetical protein